MATSGNGTGVVGYNVQVAVDTEQHLIIAHEVTNIGSDRAQLANMAMQAKAVLGVDKLEAVADRGAALRRVDDVGEEERREHRVRNQIDVDVAGDIRKRQATTVEQHRLSVAFQGLFSAFAREAPVLLVENEAQWQKIEACKGELPHLRHVVRQRGRSCANSNLRQTWSERARRWAGRK